MDELDVQILAFASAELAGAPLGLQELEAVFQQLILLRDLETASTAQLDGLGQIAGVLRSGRTDSAYRAAISTQFAFNYSQGTAPEIMEIVAALDGVTDVRVVEDSGGFSVFVYGSELDDDQRRMIVWLAREGLNGSFVSADASTNILSGGPDSGWHLISSFSSATVAVMPYDVSSLFTAGESVRIWLFGAGSSFLDTSVVSVSTTDVTLLDSVGVTFASLGAGMILENVTRGVQDPDGDGMTDAFAISAVSTTNDTFTITGDVTAWFPAGSVIRVIGSTANDGLWSLDATVLHNGDTVLWVGQPVSNAVADGQAYQVDPVYAGKVTGIGYGAVATRGGTMAEAWAISPP